MKTKVAIYETHEKALEAVKVLDKHDFPMKQVSLIGNAEIVDDHVHIKSASGKIQALTLLGIGAGVITGLVSGLGVFAIPGFGFLYGAGAVVGAFGGLDLGLASGGLVYVLSSIGIKKEGVLKYEEHLKEGRFLIVVNGNLKDIEKAEHILHTEGTHVEIGE